MGVFRNFGSDQRGATATIFGLTLLPVLGFAGAAVDYGRAASFRSQAQVAVDAAALALVREPSSLDGAGVQAKGEQFVRNALYATIGDNGRGGASVSAIVATRVGNTVKVSLNGAMQPAILQAIGYKPLAIAASSQATWGPVAGKGAGKIELALVLDNTGSMNETIQGRRKMDELQAAAKSLLSGLRDLAVEQDTVKVSVVPFDTEVRLDPTQNRNQSWLRWNNEARDKAAWSGYVFDRHGDFATSDLAPGTHNIDSLYPAIPETEYRTEPTLRAYIDQNPQHGRDLAPMRQLTSLHQYGDYRSLEQVVEDMKPRGFTNVALGVTWGMATLSRSEPFTNGAPAGDAEVKKYMVVLTDGDNTMSHVNGRLQSDVGRIDTATATACSNVKQSNVEVFTVRLLKGNVKLLRGCASSPDKYFDVQKAGELTAAFQTILRAISATRLTH